MVNVDGYIGGSAPTPPGLRPAILVLVVEQNRTVVRGANDGSVSHKHAVALKTVAQTCFAQTRISHKRACRWKNFRTNNFRTNVLVGENAFRTKICRTIIFAQTCFAQKTVDIRSFYPGLWIKPGSPVTIRCGATLLPCMNPLGKLRRKKASQSFQ